MKENICAERPRTGQSKLFEFGDSGDSGPPSGQWMVAVISFQKIYGLHGLIML